MKLVVIGVALFLVSLSGTTGLLVMKQRAAIAAAPVETSAHSDSAMTHAPADTNGAAAHAVANPAPVAAETTASASAPAAPAAPAADAPPVAGHAAPAAAVPNAVVAKSDSEGAQGYRQLARIFSNMKTTDAAKVMAYMSDEEVHGVLQRLGVRQAAGLLGSLPKERAAALSRRVLAGAEATP